MTCGLFWSTWMAMRCVLRSAARPVEANAIDIKATLVQRRRKPRMTNSLRANQYIAVFGQRQNLPDADLNRGRYRNEVRPLAGLALDGINGIEADIEAYA